MGNLRRPPAAARLPYSLRPELAQAARDREYPEGVLVTGMMTNLLRRPCQVEGASVLGDEGALMGGLWRGLSHSPACQTSGFVLQRTRGTGPAEGELGLKPRAMSWEQRDGAALQSPSTWAGPGS